MVSGPARCSFALRPAGSLTRYRAFCTNGFEHFIASMLASAATGWSVSCRVGLFTLPLEFCAFPRRTQTRSKNNSESRQLDGAGDLLEAVWTDEIELRTRSLGRAAHRPDHRRLA